MRFKSCLTLGLLLVALESKPAFAIFHDVHVKEVFAGSAAHPTAQYIMIQAWRDLQDEVQGHSVLTFDATGAPTGTFTFLNPVPNDADQMTMLLMTPDAAAIFNLTADLPMTAVLSPLGGKVCWEGSNPDDCVAWGNYTGDPTGVGTPYNQGVGIIPGYAIQRRLDICMAPDHLDQCDDTSDSENDWITVIPAPLTNPGVPGSTPPATCGNNTLEGLEGCDDNNTNNGDGCSAICHIEPAPIAPASLLVDDTATALGLSNGNGVFEPGEDVIIDPSWTNGDPGNQEVRSQIANFTGPLTGGSIYRISDGAAYYGVMLPAETKACDANSDCYLIFADATTRPATHWDASVDEILSNFGVKTWALHLGASFGDVSTDTVVNPFYPFIETILHNGVTGGCAAGPPALFCPTQNVLRREMAPFLLKGFLGSAYAPPACIGLFSDVPCPATPQFPYSDFIEDLSTRGVTGGCDAGPPALYCPGDPVTRAQMSPFLLKTLLGGAYVPPACTGIFADVPCPATPQFPFSNFIEDLSIRGITGGCDAGPPALYCPNNPVTREQMAVFLTKTFTLLLYGP